MSSLTIESGITDDLRIRTIRELSPPRGILAEQPRTPVATATVIAARRELRRILRGVDKRLAVVVGPCSVHDPAAALDYAARLARVRQRLQGSLEIIMRVYFEKPRTIVGWKGLINDPHLDGSCDIDEGLRVARRLLLGINDLGLPAACEFLDTTTPQYIADLVSWAAIGARTTESQVHRQMASGLSCPVGFKNGTDGNVQIAIEAAVSASHPHHFMAVTKTGRAAIAETSGNDDSHIILRGGKLPNFSAEDVEAAATASLRAGLRPAIIIDASHGNSGKRPERQPAVVDAICRQLEAGEERVVGMMVESNLVAGRQDHVAGRALTYGQSITDGCIDWPTTVAVLERMARAVEHRRELLSLRRDHGVACVPETQAAAG